MADKKAYADKQFYDVRLSAREIRVIAICLHLPDWAGEPDYLPSKIENATRKSLRERFNRYDNKTHMGLLVRCEKAGLIGIKEIENE